MPVIGFLMSKISAGRRVGFEVLQAVAHGAYASDALRDLGRNLDPRDAGLASQIVFGCLRHQRKLDYLISQYSGRNPAQLDDSITIALRAAIFQLRYLDRIPPHAAVHESVEWVKSHKRAATGLTNAVLRKVNREAIVWPDAATELSCPEWLLESWTAHFGGEQAKQIARTALDEPEQYIRVPPRSRPSDEVILEATAVEGCFRLISGWRAGMRLHDISSQSILPILDLRAGDSYLDLCAAPGNKTLHALETPLSLAMACDVSESRMADIPRVCPRVVLDATRPLPFSRTFDRVFVDAPCSGTGTLARNPEIKWRVQKQDLRRFGEKQVWIISQALRVLAPAGKLLYATCSLEREENEDVIAGILDTWPNLRCERSVWRLPGRDLGDGFYAALLCWRG
jgi:16S rRNA (cytosine967-C5)-methyltransferase